MFTRMDHVGVSVRDIEKAIEFYRDVIGMEKTLDIEYDATLAQITGLDGARARIVHMRFGESVVELFDYKHPQGRDPRPDHKQADFGLIHIGFMVEDFQKTYQDLKSKGVQFLGEPVEIRAGVFVAYFRGAEDEVCEMREIT